MARKKTIMREQILKAAYEVVAKEGFSHFTARNIAAKMKCSTQPIYLEFKNMEDLKSSLVTDIFHNLAYNILNQERTGDKLVDLGLNYLNFAHNEPQLYRALYLEEYGGGPLVQKFSFDYFLETVIKGTKYEQYSDEVITSIYTGCWIMVNGLASLMSSGIIDPTQEQIVNLLEKAIKNIIECESPIDLTYTIDKMKKND